MNDLGLPTTQLRILALCAGYGGLELGLQLATNGAAVGVCYVEREPFAAACLAAQMEAGHLAQAPVWLDLADFDGRPWRGVVDCVTAGFPCQPWSVAGRQRGEDDERWLWPEIARILREVQPGIVLLENTPGLASGGGLGRVLWTLARCGLDAEWDVFSASCVGAPHQRRRLFTLGYANGEPGIHALAKAAAVGDEGAGADVGAAGAWPPPPTDVDGWRSYIADGGPEPALLRGADGSATWLDERRLSGGGVVPLVAAHAVRTLAARAVSG